MSTDGAGESAPNSKRESGDHELNDMENVQRVIQALREKHVMFVTFCLLLSHTSNDSFNLNPSKYMSTSYRSLIASRRLQVACVQPEPCSHKLQILQN